MNKTDFVYQLPEEQFAAIKLEIMNALNGKEFTGYKRHEAFVESIDSRLCDLSDLIDIKKYVTGGNK